MGPFEGVREMDHWEVGRRHLGSQGETVLGQWGSGRPDRGAGACQGEWVPGAAEQPQAAWCPPTEPLVAPSLASLQGLACTCGGGMRLKQEVPGEGCAVHRVCRRPLCAWVAVCL